MLEYTKLAIQTQFGSRHNTGRAWNTCSSKQNEKRSNDSTQIESKKRGSYNKPREPETPLSTAAASTSAAPTAAEVHNR
eukprot:2515968-Amphidinium_carterae.1